jgi:PPOX class probable F420-dependent enzyme
MSFALTAAEREQFLAGVHVGVLSVTVGEGRGPLTVPVWYSYQPGGTVSVITGRSSRKARAVEAAGRMSLCAQDEAPPYTYVSVEGPAVIEEAEFEERLAMAHRYLGPEGGDQYMAANADSGREDIVIRLTPGHWLSADFGKQSG